ncbi:hypothetical protein FQN57_003279 [Myotisia sp. PD_48]|nr:hypothetical protein FQN57_003279 [Myotisia sp. PD_48]
MLDEFIRPLQEAEQMFMPGLLSYDGTVEDLNQNMIRRVLGSCDIFSAQPTRRFVHAFAIYSTRMEAWVFARSGPYSSGAFNIHKDPDQFLRIMVGYTLMSDAELGLDIFIKNNKDGLKKITVEAPGTKQKIDLNLDLVPLCLQHAIVCRGTCCYTARLGDSIEGVAKFSWVSDKRQSEIELLELARQRGGKGVAKVIGYSEITSIAEMRDSLVFGKHHIFRPTESSGTISTFSHPPSRPESWVRGLGITNSKSNPKSNSKSNSTKRRSSEQGPTLSKRTRSSQPPITGQQNELPYQVQDVQDPAPSIFGKTEAETCYDNRILRCLVISPAGRPIYAYNGPIELLMALRDAIKAHQSLHSAGNILHRDISENNIIITDPVTVEGYTGMLIDLDLAKEVGSERSGARHQTGTMEFMAIQVLLKVDHTYRHDLESFFYVLIWQCARRGWGKAKYSRESRLQERYSIKLGHMTKGPIGFERILLEFPHTLEDVKPLCRAIRDILFSIRAGEPFYGTPKDLNSKDTA